MKSWGVTFIIIGIGSFFLRKFNIQFTLFMYLYHLIGSELITALVFIGAGLFLILFASFLENESSTSAISKPETFPCNNCIHSDNGIFCDKFQFNVKEYPKKYLKKCNKKFYVNKNNPIP